MWAFFISNKIRMEWKEEKEYIARGQIIGFSKLYYGDSASWRDYRFKWQIVYADNTEKATAANTVFITCWGLY